MTNLQALTDTYRAPHYSAAQYEDCRGYPRIDVRNLPAVVLLPDRKLLAVAVLNISPDGVKIDCNRDVARHLHARGNVTEADKGQPLRLQFKIPRGDGLTAIQTTCRICYFADTPDGHAALGLAFLHFHGAGECHLGKFFEEALEPAIYG